MQRGVGYSFAVDRSFQHEAGLGKSRGELAANSFEQRLAINGVNCRPS